MAALVLAGSGLSCTLPQRVRTFIPPTSERDLCQWDDRFFYSSVYDYCFRYPSEDWKRVTSTGPRTLIGTSITANTFSLTTAETAIPIFDLYVTGFSEQARQEMAAQNINIAYDADPYIIGYIVREPTEETALYAAAVPRMMEYLQVFAKPQGRQ